MTQSPEKREDDMAMGRDGTESATDQYTDAPSGATDGVVAASSGTEESSPSGEPGEAMADGSGNSSEGEQSIESIDGPSANEPVSEDASDDDSAGGDDDAPKMEWYILKVQVNREDTIREALLRRIKMEGLEDYFGQIIVPVEEVAEFSKSGKRRIVKRKLYPGYILVHMVINDDTWFLVRETPGVGDFTGSAGKPTPMEPQEVERVLRVAMPEEAGAGQVRTAIPFRVGDRVRVKDGNFENFEGDVDSIDETHGRVTVVIQIFNRPTPVELEHWQIESV